LVGSAPLILSPLTLQTAVLSSGLPELGMLWSRLVSDPLVFVLASGKTVIAYIAADDLERLSAVGASWQLGDWGSLPGAIISLAPTILKAVGLLGLLSLCWLERFDAAVERARLPALFLSVLVVGAGLGVVDERSPLAVVALLITFAFACLPSLVPGAPPGF